MTPQLPEDLLTCITDEQDRYQQHLNANHFFATKHSARYAQARDTIVLFLVTVVLTVGLLLLAAWRGQ